MYREATLVELIIMTSTQINILRVLASLILLVLGFIFPWWVLLILLILAMWYFRNYVEAIIVAGLVEQVFVGTVGSSWRFTLIVVAVFLIIVLLKQRIIAR